METGYLFRSVESRDHALDSSLVFIDSMRSIKFSEKYSWGQINIAVSTMGVEPESDNFISNRTSELKLGI